MARLPRWICAPSGSAAVGHVRRLGVVHSSCRADGRVLTIPAGSLPRTFNEWHSFCRVHTHAVNAESCSGQAGSGSGFLAWCCPRYPYPFFPCEKSKFSCDFAQVGFSDLAFVLGRTYGTYLHYERSYSINVFFSEGRGPRPRFDLPPKKVRYFPAIFPRDFSFRLPPAIYGQNSRESTG